ncbi:hypothetical protein FCH28_01585 [Streptomyces piniterrae]|uniref:Uncharacterized protein n=1 Tax=Streptomyces piniterrae TaxID=2571125 RepID=A0A4U0NVT9_9ACTN|nr:hypothetical protein [Streptomyces piniterrae]TJZ58876.1 hypothetical protein FCH28_01585 [Streptomyces piniterrae]
MTDNSHSALRLALSLAGPDTADALAERLRPKLPPVLADRFGLPEELVEELLGADAAQMRAALSIDPEEWLLGAAELGDPVVGLALWRAVYRNDAGGQMRAVGEIPGLLATLLHAADLGDLRWYEGDGLFSVLYDEATGPLLLPVLTSGLVGLDVGALAVFGRHLPPPVVIDACLGLLDLWGSTAPFRQYLHLLDHTPALDPGHPWLPDLLRQALDAPDPEPLLRAHRPPGEWADPDHLHALLALRYGDAPSAKPDGLDWELLRREHQRLPFGTQTPHHSGYGYWYAAPLTRLTTWEGCPVDLVMDAFHEYPAGTAADAAELPFEALAGPEARTSEIYLRPVLGRGIREGRYSVDRVLAEVRPAVEVPDALPYDHEPARKAFAGLLARLGTDPVNWLTCYARMRRADGSIADLIMDVTSPDSRKKRCTSWPWAQAAQFPAGRPVNARAAFLAMLRCVPEEVQKAVIPHLDLRAVQHFLVYGEPSPEIRDAVVAAHGLPAQIAMAGSHHLSDEQTDYLLDLDEPAVDAKLFSHARLKRSERERILAGRLRGGGIRPVAEELLTALDEVNINVDRDRLVAGVGSGDLRVARKIVRCLRLRVPATRTRLLVAVWERGGPDAVREILAMGRLPARLRRWTERALDAPDGLERLRARLAEEESPAELLEFLTATTDPGKRLRGLRAEGIRLPWTGLVTAQDAGTLPAQLLDRLAEQPDCPRELLLAALATTPESGAKWIPNAFRSGRLTPEDLLTHAAPARAALAVLRQYAADWPEAAGRPVVCRAAALPREHLGTDVEAWSVGLQLLPTFVGTLPELIVTAGAMTRVA